MMLPAVVRAYFEADSGHDPDAVVQTFSADAAVEDDGALHRGADAIRAWWVAAKETYCHVAEPIEMTAAENEICVLAKVTGQFPSSPAMLEFFFAFENGKIAKLRIR